MGFIIIGISLVSNQKISFKVKYCWINFNFNLKLLHYAYHFNYLRTDNSFIHL